jgi:hypothetical protein
MANDQLNEKDALKKQLKTTRFLLVLYVVVSLAYAIGILTSLLKSGDIEDWFAVLLFCCWVGLAVSAVRRYVSLKKKYQEME